MKGTIIYFPGFNGANSKKFGLIKNYFSDYSAVEFKQEYDWKIDFQKFDEIINEVSAKSIFLVGSSLGAIYSIYFGLKYKIRTLLINPSFYPEITLKDSIDSAHLLSLLEVKGMIENFDYSTNADLFTLFLTKDDERLTFGSFLTKFSGVKDVRWYEDKGHSFRNFE